jgi:hypothetical protein
MDREREFIIRTFIEDKKIKALLDKVKNIKLLSNDKENTFEHISENITDRTTLKLIITMFENIYNLEYVTDIGSNPINTPTSIRCFLSIFMIIYQSEVIFSNIGTIEKDLITHANKLLASFKDLLENYNSIIHIQTFKKQYEQFDTNFNAWKNNDKRGLLLILYNSYQELIETQKKLLEDKYDNEIDKEKSKIWANEIDKQKKQIETEIRKIGGEHSLEKCINGQILEDLVPEDIKKNIYSTLQKAYWNKIKEELTKIDIPESTIRTLKDIKNHLKKLVPSRHDLQNKWEKQFKIELLEYQFKDINERNKFILKFGHQFIEIINELESPERKADFDDTLLKIKDKTIIEQIIEIFYSCYLHIENIYLDIENLKVTLENYQKKITS